MTTTELFRCMFPDSRIAEQFACREKKTAYLCVFGIAEYIKTLILKDILSDSEYYVVRFDESLNKKSQSKQMDFHLRYWVGNQVTTDTRYIGSQFMGHGTAEDMIIHFNEGIKDLNTVRNKLIHISMDGPNVNWKFFYLFYQQFMKDHGCSMVNIGSYGLNIVHNVFKTGAQATEWNISSLLSSLYYLLFKDSPARREDFVNVTGVKEYPPEYSSPLHPTIKKAGILGEYFSPLTRLSRGY